MRLILANVEIVRVANDATQTFEWDVIATYSTNDASMSRMKRWSRYADAVESCKDVPDTIVVSISL